MPEIHALVGKTGAAILIVGATIAVIAVVISSAAAACSAVGALLGRLL